MSSPDSLLTIRRKILPIEHQQLRDHMPIINRLGDLGIKWHRLGETGVTLIERGIYQRAQKASGHLATVSAVEVAREINESVIQGIASASKRLVAGVTNVDYFGEGKFLSIAYTLEDDKLLQERSQLIDWLDRRNGINSDWEELDAHVSVATVDANNATNDILDAFWNIRPELVTLLPLTAEAL